MVNVYIVRCFTGIGKTTVRQTEVNAWYSTYGWQHYSWSRDWRKALLQIYAYKSTVAWLSLCSTTTRKFESGKCKLVQEFNWLKKYILNIILFPEDQVIVFLKPFFCMRLCSSCNNSTASRNQRCPLDKTMDFGGQFPARTKYIEDRVLKQGSSSTI